MSKKKVKIDITMRIDVSKESTDGLDASCDWDAFVVGRIYNIIADAINMDDVFEKLHMDYKVKK
jgi:hypothetical protein